MVLKKIEDIIPYMRELEKQKTSFFVIGGCTNIIASDKGYKGVILKIETKNISVCDLVHGVYYKQSPIIE